MNLGLCQKDIDIDGILAQRKQDKFFNDQWKGGPSSSKKPLGDVLHTGAWKGRRCFIIAGGPSVNEVNLPSLSNELTIGINRVYETFYPTILFAMDGNFQDSILRKDYGANALNRYNDYQGLKLWLDIANIGIRECYYVRSIARWGLTHKLEHGLCHGNNAGFGALNLAYVLGANPIYLIGYDLKVDGNKTHYHDGHFDKRGRKKIMTNQSMMSFFKAHNESAPIFRDNGIKIINLNKDSALRTYPFGNMPKDLNKKKNPIYVSFYTGGGVYERDVIRLKESIWKHSLDCDIRKIPSKNNWLKAVREKPKFIKKMMIKHKSHPIVWVDSDAKIISDPKLFSKIKEDFGYYKRPRSNRINKHKETEMLSGTLYFKNNKRSRDLVDLWIQKTEKNQDVWDQRTLEIAFNIWIRDIKNMYYELPASYCCVFDGWEKKNGVVPIIEHYQLSRQVKYHGAKG